MNTSFDCYCDEYFWDYMIQALLSMIHPRLESVRVLFSCMQTTSVKGTLVDGIELRRK
jgi:hypothetical protein